MYQYYLNHKLIWLLYTAFLSSCYEVTSNGTILSPLGVVSVCPGGQILLTCERTSGSFLYWDFFTPQLMGTNRERIVTSQGVLLPEFKIDFTEFNITLISANPLVSQLLIKNVTTEINGSTVYCSEDGNEANASMLAISVTNRDDGLQSGNHSLNITLVNQLLRNNDVTVTLQWPREDGVIYSVYVFPEISHTDLAKTMSHNTFMINLTIIISYNIQYNVSIISSLCGATATKVLNYILCDRLPIHLLYSNVIVTMGSDKSRFPLEGQSITYTCPNGYILTGPNTSVCTGNGEWEPDPGQVECIADPHGCEVPLMNKNVKLNYSSTLNGSVLLILTCESNTTDEQILHVTCHSNGTWIPDPDQFNCLSISAEIPTRSSPSTEIILGSVMGVAFGAMAVIIAISAVLCLAQKGFLHLKRANRLLDIQLETTYHSYFQNSSEQTVSVQQDTLVYADIGPSSVKKRAKPVVTLCPDDMDDRIEYAQLNHTLQSTVQDSVADGSLNLHSLLIQMQGTVTPRWYQLGKALEVNKDVLDRCTNYHPEESIVEILDHWLRNFPGHPTWRDVANALRKIDLQQLADDIEMVYETGKLPIEVDAQKVFSITQEKEKKTLEKANFNSCQDQDESAPPLPPKPLAGSGVPKISAPPIPPKYVPK